MFQASSAGSGEAAQANLVRKLKAERADKEVVAKEVGKLMAFQGGSVACFFVAT